MNDEVTTERSGAVVTLTLSNPSRRNAISYRMYDQFEEACNAIGDDEEIRILVLRGAGDSFAGGTDIRHFVELTNGKLGVEYERHMARVQSSLLRLRIPVISVVRGVCVGGGLVLAALSDLVYCTPEARFGSPIAHTLGNTLSGPSLARLYECFGRRRTSEMLMTARLFGAQEALRAGFVNSVEEPGDLEAKLAEVVSAILQCAPLSLRSFKELERRIDSAALAVSSEDVFATVYGSADFREGVDSFLGKRPAQFRGQ